MPDKETWIEVKDRRKGGAKRKNGVDPLLEDGPEQLHKKCSCCTQETENRSRNQNRWQVFQDQDQDQHSEEEQIILQPCTLIKPACMNTVESKDGWTKVRFMVDSGANDTVMPPEELPEIPTRESRGSRLGWSYRVANGAEVSNEGEKEFRGMVRCQSGWSKNPKTVTAQVADITQPLMAVKKMTKSGYKVIFDEEGSGALNKVTHEWIPMEEEEDAWFLDLWVKSEDQKNESRTGFHRQE